MLLKHKNTHCCNTNLQQSLRLNHSTPGAHFLTSNGVNDKHYRNGIQFIICANLSAFSCIIIHLYLQNKICVIKYKITVCYQKQKMLIQIFQVYHREHAKAACNIFTTIEPIKNLSRRSCKFEPS